MSAFTRTIWNQFSPLPKNLILTEAKKQERKINGFFGIGKARLD
jgi:hypothetical protein